MRNHGAETVIFAAVSKALTSFGLSCCTSNASLSTQYSTDWGLPHIVYLLNTPSKRHAALSIYYAFLPDDVLSHKRAIQSLRAHLPSIPLLIHTLSICIFMENSILDDALLDLYHYYANMGITQSSPTLQAASIAMLVAFLPYNTSYVVQVLPLLSRIDPTTSWWEVQGQTLIVLSTLLLELDNSGNEDEVPISKSLDLIERLFHPDATLTIRRLGASYLAKNLQGYPELMSMYLSVLTTLPLEVLQPLLHDETILNVVGTSGGIYHLPPMLSSWPVPAVAKHLAYTSMASLESITIHTLTLFHACLESLVKESPGIILELAPEVLPMLISSMGLGASGQILAGDCLLMCIMYGKSATFLKETSWKKMVVEVLEGTTDSSATLVPSLVDFCTRVAQLNGEMHDEMVMFLNHLGNTCEAMQNTELHTLWNELK